MAKLRSASLSSSQASRYQPNTAGVILDPQSLSLQGGRGHRAEGRSRGSRGNGGEAQAAGGFTQVQALVLRQVRQPAGEGAQVFLEQAAAGVFQQALHDGEGLQLCGAEP